jgi:hypothetical protein
MARYVALKRIRFGPDHIETGEEVPFERGRNYTLMLRQGLIADLNQQEQGDGGAALSAATQTIATLEGHLAEANEEIADLREQLEEAQGGEPAEEGGDETPADEDGGGDGEGDEDAPALESLKKPELLGLANQAGVDVPAGATKAVLIDLLRADESEE